jgi:hypothetical protein
MLFSRENKKGEASAAIAGPSLRRAFGGLMLPFDTKAKASVTVYPWRGNYRKAAIPNAQSLGKQPVSL